MVTMEDVAKKAGVSKATVSRVINNNKNVSKKTRLKILEAINDLDYIPNEVARSLYRKSSNIVALIVPDISNPFFSAMAKGVEDFTRKNNYMVMLCNTEGDKERLDSYITFFTQHNISGILIVNEGLATIPKSIPYVSLDRSNNDDSNYVITDDFFGGQLAAKSIIETNPKNVLVMRGPKGVFFSDTRFKGISSEFSKYPNIKMQIFQAESYQVEQASTVAKKIFNEHKNFDSIISLNDIYALEIIKEARSLGISVPEDVQIIGYDGISHGRYSYPTLSTIGQPAYEIGYEASEILFHLFIKSSHDSLSLNKEMKPWLIERNSLRSHKK